MIIFLEHHLFCLVFAVLEKKKAEQCSAAVSFIKAYHQLQRLQNFRELPWNPLSVLTRVNQYDPS